MSEVGSKTEYIDAFAGDTGYPMTGEMFEEFIRFYGQASTYSDFSKEAYDYAMQEQYRRLTEMGENAGEIMNNHIQNVMNNGLGNFADNKYANAIINQIDYTNFTNFVDAKNGDIFDYVKFIKDEGIITDAANSIKMGEYAPSHAESKAMREKAKIIQKQMGWDVKNNDSFSSMWGQVTNNSSAQSIGSRLKDIGAKIKEWAQNAFENLAQKRFEMAESVLNVSDNSASNDLEAEA